MTTTTTTTVFKRLWCIWLKIAIVCSANWLHFIYPYKFFFVRRQMIGFMQNIRAPSCDANTIFSIFQCGSLTHRGATSIMTMSEPHESVDAPRHKTAQRSDINLPFAVNNCVRCARAAVAGGRSPGLCACACAGDVYANISRGGAGAWEWKFMAIVRA